MTDRFLVSDTPFDAAIYSIIGKRERQEDAACVASTKCAVFDGLGGHWGGAQASEAAAHHFMAACYRDFAPSVRETQSRVKGLSGGLTTIAAAWIGERIEYAWAGDSRVYVFRQNRVAADGWSRMQRRSLRSSLLVQLTGDHGGRGNPISRCLGSGCGGPEFGSAPRLYGDILILTTDGFHEVIDAQIFEQVLTNMMDARAEVIAEALIYVMKAKADDNATVLVVKT